MEDAMNYLKENHTLNLVKLPTGKRTIDLYSKRKETERKWCIVLIQVTNGYKGWVSTSENSLTVINVSSVRVVL